jgi:hypothetical protein
MDGGEKVGLRDVDVKHPAMQVTMPVVSNHNGELRCVGTAFAVAPGLAITAEHVVANCIDYQRLRDGYTSDNATVGINAYQWFGDRILRSQ